MTVFAIRLAEIAGALAASPPILNWVSIPIPDGACPMWYADELAVEFRRSGIRTWRDRTVHQDHVRIAFEDAAIAAQLLTI